MVLNNYWLIKTYTEVNTMVSNTYNVTLGTIDMGGTNRSIYINVGTGSASATFMNHAVPARCIKADLRAVLGTGTTAPQSNNYALETDVSSSFSDLSTSCSTSSDGSSEVTTITITGTNNTANDITISEIGLYKNLVYNSTGDTGAFLLVREVLAEPFTVLAGSTFTKTFTWTESSASALTEATRSTPSNNTKSAPQEDPNGPEEGKKEDLEPMEEKEDISEPVEEKKISNAEPEEEFEEETIKG